MQILRGILSIGLGIAAWAGVFWLLSEGFLPVQRWYFHRYIERFDPDPPFLPLESVVFLVFPCVATVLGGVVAGFVLRRRSYLLSILLAVIFVAGTIILEGGPTDRELVLYSVLIGVTGFCSSILGQWLAQRASVRRQSGDSP
jgi:uncharacterized membrane protein